MSPQKPPLLEQLKKLDKAIAADAKNLDNWVDRANLRLSLGFSEAGLSDIKQAIQLAQKAGEPLTYRMHGLLAEGHRLFARDVLFTGGKGTRKDIGKHIDQECLPEFGKALTLLKGSSNNAAAAWIYAHRGAAHLLKIWSFADPDEDPQNYDDAERDFRAAEDANPKYTWVLEFHAFMHALRGDPKRGDFEAAKKLLEQVQGLAAGGRPQTSLQRAFAMLSSYEHTEKANWEAVESGLQAAVVDQEEFKAPYYATECLARLAREDEDIIRQGHLKAAIETTRGRALAAIAEARIVLGGLSLIEGKDEDARKVLRSLLDGDGTGLRRHASLESLAMVLRDRIWQRLKQAPEYQQLMRLLTTNS